MAHRPALTAIAAANRESPVIRRIDHGAGCAGCGEAGPWLWACPCPWSWTCSWEPWAGGGTMRQCYNITLHESTHTAVIPAGASYPPPPGEGATKHASTFSRQHSPEVCKFIGPLKERGRREDRVRAAPAVSCAKVANKNAHEHTGSAEASGLPCAMVLQLISCSPRRDQSLFVTVIPRKRELLRSLTPAIGASGPHDFAVRLSRARQSQPLRPPHPTARS
jgi:hypothetical protein